MNGIANLGYNRDVLTWFYDEWIVDLNDAIYFNTSSESLISPGKINHRIIQKPMDSMNLNEAYASVYLEEDFETLLDDISDEELSEIVEEVVASAIEEGYELEEIEECFGDTLFDQVISEARVTSDADRPGGGAKVTTGQGSRMVAKDRLAKRTADKESRKKSKS